MKIIVCVKQVIDTAAKIFDFRWTRGKKGDLINYYLKSQQNLKEGRLEKDGSGRILNVYDEFALEEAIKIKEKIPDTEVTVITLGPELFQKVLRTGLAMGADRAIHLLDPAFYDLDNLGVALALSNAISSMPYDLILCGRHAIDDNMAQVGPALALYLGIPCVTTINKLTISEDRKRAEITRHIESGFEIIETSIPLLVTCQKDLNNPRMPSLQGIKEAKKKEIKEMDAASIGFNLDFIGLAKHRVKEIDLTLPPTKKKGLILEGPAKESVPKLVKFLSEEKKIF